MAIQKAQVYEPVCPRLDRWSGSHYHACQFHKLSVEPSPLHSSLYWATSCKQYRNYRHNYSTAVCRKPSTNFKFFRLANEIPKTLVNWERLSKPMEWFLERSIDQARSTINRSAPKMIRVANQLAYERLDPWAFSTKSDSTTLVPRKYRKQLRA